MADESPLERRLWHIIGGSLATLNLAAVVWVFRTVITLQTQAAAMTASRWTAADHAAYADQQARQNFEIWQAIQETTSAVAAFSAEIVQHRRELDRLQNDR